MLAVDIPTTVSTDCDILCVDFYNGKKPVRFICIYIPPFAAKCPIAVSDVCCLLTRLFIRDLPLFLLGDFNLPKIDWNVPMSYGNTAHDTFFEFCAENSLHQCVNESTHEKGNILDLFFTNVISYNSLLSCNVLCPMSSTCDHSLISCCIKVQNNHSLAPSTQKFRDFKQADYYAINEQLASADWSFIFDLNLNLQQMYDHFISLLQNTINQNVPVKTIRNKSKKIKKPFHIIKLLKEKMDLYKSYKLDKSLLNKYKSKSKEYDRAVRNWHNSYELKICSNPSSKKFYNHVNRKLKVRNEIPVLKDCLGNIIQTEEAKSNLLNSHFQKVFTIDDGSAPNIPSYSTNLMNDFEISADDVLLAVKNSKDKISRTPEEIPTYFIKRVISTILQPLVILFNRSLKCGLVPSQWKHSIIIPIFKKGDRSNPKNYRPISQTSSFCRLLESILFKKIYFHLSSNNLISSCQFGFLPGRSSCSQLLSCIHQWCHNFSENLSTSVVYTDIAKAFDSVSHQKLLSVIKSYGLSPTVCNWVKDFLTGRSQQVTIGEKMSSNLSVLSGVPQGSVLGPLLFLIYINIITLCNIFLEPEGRIVLFADDAKIFSHNNLKLQNALNSTSCWLKKVQLNLAEHKCIHLQIIKPSLKVNQPNMFINNIPIQKNSYVKDLGVFVSTDLKWSKHINYISSSASSQSYLLFKSFSSRCIWVLLKLYKTYVRPKLEYNTPVWSPYLTKDINLIENVQKRFTKYAFRRCGIPYNSYNDRLYKINLKSLQYRRIVFDLILFYKIFIGLSDLNFSDYFKLKTRHYNLREHNFQTESIINFSQSHNQISNCYFNRVCKYWNALPQDIVNANTLSIFQVKLKNFDLSGFLK